jgi:hypothetical protein
MFIRFFSEFNFIKSVPGLLLCIAISYNGIAQNKVTGSVTDILNKPIERATVQLEKIEPAQVLNTVFTNAKGIFQFQCDTGRYLIKVMHTGYGVLSSPIHVQSGDNIVSRLQLTSTSNELQNVTVTSRKTLIEVTNDKISYNAENDPGAKAESVSDLLRKVPLVTVDGEGNIQLNGQSNFKILLNGRETALFAQNVKEAVKAFPGSVISKIEVITSPSAKYDAEGVGGLINLITKKKIAGYNAILSTYYSTLSN